MKRIAQSWDILTAAMLVSLGAGSGCSFISAPKVTVEEQVTLSIPAGGAEEISVRTHNGRVTIVGADGSAEIVAHVHKQARARTLERAEECMAAIELTTEGSGTTQVLGWKWNTTRARDCGATVAFDVEVPEHFAATAKTHNGRVEVTGIEGDCKLKTHNGRIRVASSSRSVDAETHNGNISIVCGPEEVRAVTHNGSVVAELNGTGNVAGAITTHNGSVILGMKNEASAKFNCSTHNGHISSKIELTDVSESRRKLTGRKGDASGELRVKTYNGSITLKNAG